MIAAVTAVLAVHSVAASPSRLQVSFSGSEVVVSGSTPKGEVALVGLVHEPRGTHSRIEAYTEMLEDSDGDGTTRFALKSHEITWRAVWGAVDLRTGDYVVAAPERSPGKQSEFRGKGIGRAANGKLASLQHAGNWLNVMVVRSSGDVLHAVAVDAGLYDLDGESNGVVDVSFDALGVRRGKGEKPDEYRPGDVVFVIDPDDLSMVAVKVK